MAVKFCPNCGNKIDGSPNFCPKCGYNLAEFQNEQSNENHDEQSGRHVPYHRDGPTNNPIVEEEKRRIEAAKGITSNDEEDKTDNQSVNSSIVEEEMRMIKSDPDYKAYKALGDNSMSFAEYKQRKREYEQKQGAKAQRRAAQKDLWNKFMAPKPKKTHYVRNTLMFGILGTMHSSHIDKKNKKRFK